MLTKRSAKNRQKRRLVVRLKSRQRNIKYNVKGPEYYSRLFKQYFDLIANLGNNRNLYSFSTFRSSHFLNLTNFDIYIFRPYYPIMVETHLVRRIEGSSPPTKTVFLLKTQFFSKDEMKFSKVPPRPK